jgi:hypothetical protein
VFVNALTALKRFDQSGADPMLAQSYLRAAFQTQRCDRIAAADLSSTRAQLVHAVGGEAAARRLIEPRGAATAQDGIEAAAAVRHYAVEHRSQLLGALDVGLRIQYHAAQGVDNAAGVLGSVASLFGMGKAVAPKRSNWRVYFPEQTSSIPLAC